ncbi:MAG TPA: hypothetical protein VK939_02575 [Longimicrobiales bacterium]|nr:hypothetical protein [Longimicrobiales bacterium]
MKSLGLWTLALLLMLASAVWQRRTGPSYPVRGELPAAPGALAYQLPRSHVTTSGAVVSVPAVRPGGALIWRRYPTDEAFEPIPLAVRGDSLAAVLPPQPPAGKVEYYVELYGVTDTLRLPAHEAAVLRYRGPVSAAALLPHVLLMFIAMLIAVRAALGAAVGRDEPTLAWLALLGFTIGGLVFGPIVQQQAFGAYWTGVPFGWDLTDNKTLMMWLAWLVACLVPLRRPSWRRGLVLVAAVITIAVYLIPHSTRGSQLDYERNELDAVSGRTIESGSSRQV